MGDACFDILVDAIKKMHSLRKLSLNLSKNLLTPECLKEGIAEFQCLESLQ